MAIDVTEKYAPRKFLLDLGGFTSTDLSTFLKENNIAFSSEEGYPIFAIMKALNAARKKGRFGSDTDLDAELKKEKIDHARIVNSLKMKKLIPRDSAVNRMRTTLQALATKISYGAKLAAPRLPGLMNVRDIEKILIESWESAIDSLEEEANALIDWEKYEINIQSARARVAEDSSTSISSGDSSEDSFTDEE